MISVLVWFPVLLAALVVLMIITSTVTVWLFDLAYRLAARKGAKTPPGAPPTP
jgi:hypothetical protein